MKGVSKYICLSCFLTAKIGSIAGLVVLVTLPIFAQQAQLSGIIEDPSGSRISAAKLWIVDEDTKAERRTESNSSGLYSLPDLPPGPYRIEVEAQGFESVNRTGILLEVGQTARLDFRLQVAGTAEAVTVTGDASSINTTDGSVGMTVNGDLVQNLPLNGRSFQQLITMAPGVNMAPGSANGQLTVNGQRPTANYFTVDGVSANIGPDRATGGGTTLGTNAAGGTNGLVSVDALQEFRILTSSYAPEYGRTPGGQVILLTRSGTNQFHGDVFDYIRNDMLDANDWFANSLGKGRSPLRFNDFGGVLGGPIVPNHTFFFFSYEGQRLRQPLFAISLVPDLASRQSAPPPVQAVLNAFPLPNGPDLGKGQAQFAAGYSDPINTDATSFRLDQIFNSRLSGFARYNYAPSTSESRGFGGTSDLANIEHLPYKTQTLTLGATYVITPTTVNETRINLSKSSQSELFTPDNFGGAIPPPASALFLPPLSPQTGYTYVSLGFTGGAYYDGMNTGSKQRQINLVDGLSYSFGSHQMKLGADYRELFPYNSGFFYDDYFFGNVSDAMTNVVGTFLHGTQSRTRANISNLSAYVQDTWRFSSRLTVTYGIRWELNTPPHDQDPNNGNYVPLLGNYLAGTVTVGAGGRSLWNTHYLNFAPRLGMAYSVGGNPGWETVLRAGAGSFYDLGTGDSAINPWLNGFPNLNYTLTNNTSLPINPRLAIIPSLDLANPASGYFWVYPRNLALPRTWQWNVSVEQSIARDNTITISYVAALGRRLLYEQEYPSVGPNGYVVYTTDNFGSSSYQSLQLFYRRRLSKGLTGTTAYSWAHSLDTDSNELNPIPPGQYLAPSSNKGPSDFDIRHTMSGSLSYSIPGFVQRPWLRNLTREWGVDSIISAHSTLPVDVTSYDSNFLFGDFALRPNLVIGEPLYLYGPKYAGGRAINPAAFSVNPNYQGDLGRNALRGFDFVQVDLSLRRSFQIAERLRLVFRSDLFNVFNHPNFANPDSSLNDGTFGLSTSLQSGQTGGAGNGYGLNPVFNVGGPRSVQFSLKLQF